jgi:hypothetical protein
MKTGLTTRLAKLEAVKEGGQLAIVWVHPDKRDEAEEEAARLEAMGRRVLLVRWQWSESE